MKKFQNVLWGTVIIAIGIVIGLNSLGITNINIFFNGWWTLFIIVPSFIGLFKKDNRIWSLIWLIVGIILLLCAQNILSFAIIRKLILPCLLIAIGISIIFKDTLNKRVNENISKLNHNKSNLKRYCAVFGEQKVDLAGEEFKGANVDAIFGSVDLNMEKSTITVDQIINTNAIFGGVKIVAPKNINIKIKSTPILGCVDNKLKIEYKENLPTIYINSFTLFGCVEII